MFTKAFWQDAAQRAVRTFAQTLVVLWGGDQFNILSVDWQQSLGAAGGAAVLAILMALTIPPSHAQTIPSHDSEENFIDYGDQSAGRHRADGE